LEESKTPVAVPSKGDNDEEVPDEDPYTYIEDTEWRNSRESGKDIHKYKFDVNDKEEFVKNSRSSTLLYSSIAGLQLHQVSLDDFKVITVLGKGTFGKVYLAMYQDNQKIYAIKAI
jgi:hypothetical protein